jgi:TP901 family phage tail tape measure protein
MADNQQIKDVEVGIGPAESSFRKFEQFSDMLKGVHRALLEVKEVAAGIQVGEKKDQQSFIQELKGLQSEMRVLLNSVRSGAPNIQANAAVLSGAEQTRKFADKNMELLSNQQLIAYLERRVLLEKQLGVASEANRQYAAGQISINNEIEATTKRVVLQAERYKQALIEGDRTAEDSAKRELRNGRDRIELLQKELELRERGAKVRLGRALDQQNNQDATLARAQLDELNDDKSSVAAARRTIGSAQRQAEALAKAELDRTGKQMRSAQVEDNRRAIAEGLQLERQMREAEVWKRMDDAKKEAALEKMMRAALIEDTARTNAQAAQLESRTRQAELWKRMDDSQKEAALEKMMRAAQAEDARRDRNESARIDAQIRAAEVWKRQDDAKKEAAAERMLRAAQAEDKRREETEADQLERRTRQAELWKRMDDAQKEAALEKMMRQASAEDKRRTLAEADKLETQTRAAEVWKRMDDAKKEIALEKMMRAAAAEDARRDRKEAAQLDAQIRQAEVWKLLDDRKKEQALEKAMRQAYAEDLRRDQAKQSQTPASQEARDAATRERRYNQTFGDGGAAIALTQTALLANYTVTQGFMQAFRSAIQFTVEYEEALAHLKTITQATNSQMMELSGTIEGVSNASRYSAVDLAKAAAALSETGVTVSQMGVALKGVADLATATGESFDQTVQTVTGAFGAWNLSATDTLQITNQIAQAVNSSRLTMDKLRMSIETAGETASEAGVSFKDMLAATVAITDSGTASGATLGGGLRQLLIDLEKPSKSMKAILDQLGLTQEDISVKTHGLAGALQNLKDAGFTSADAMQAFEARSASAFTSLSTNLPRMAEFQLSLNNTDAAARANADQMNTLGAQFDRFKNQTSILVGEAFKPLLDGFKNLLMVVSDFESAMRESTLLVEGLGLAFGTGALAVALRYIGGLLGGLAGLAVGGFEAAAGVAAIGAAIGPVVALVAGLGAGLYFLMQKANESTDTFETQRTAVNGAKDAMKESKQAYDSVGQQIETLRNKTQALNNDHGLLKQATDDAGQQFEKYGVQLDKNGIEKTEDLIQKLEDLRGQLAKRYEMNTDVLGAQLGYMVQKAQEAAGERARELQGRIAGPNGLIRKALDNDLPTVDGGEGFLSRTERDQSSFGLLTGRKQSQGGIPLSTGLNAQTIPGVVQYLKDLGVNVTEKVVAGFVDAAGVNGQPHDLVAQGAAATALNEALGNVTRARRAPGMSEDDKLITKAQEQALSNLLAEMTKVTQGVQTAESYQRDLKREQESSANQKFANSDPRAKAISDAVTAARQDTLNTLGLATGPVERVWSALKMQESGNRQLDANGNPIRSMPGNPDSPVGIAQIKPSTARDVAQRNGIPFDQHALEYDSAYNERLGKLYLKQNIDAYGGDVNMGLASYNWGPGAFANFVSQKTKDGRSYDYRDPTGVTKDEFIQLLTQAHPETGKYVSQVGRGLGALGRLNTLEGNSALTQQSASNATLLRQLEGELAETTEGPKKEFLKGQIDDLQKSQNEVRSKLESARAEAASDLKKTDEASAKALKARLGEVNRQIEGTLDPKKAGALGDDAVGLIRETYQGHIDTIERSSAKMGKTGEFSDAVKQQLESLHEEMDAAIRTQIDKNKQKVDQLKERIEQLKFKSDLRASDRAFSSFMQSMKDFEDARANRMGIELKENARPVSMDNARAALMGDPRYAARFSGVQRQSLSMRTAVDQDNTDAKDMVTYAANLRQLQEEKARYAAALAQTAALGVEGDGTKGSATGLYAKRDELELDPEKQNELKRVEQTIADLAKKREASQAALNDLKLKENTLTEKQSALQAKLAAKDGTKAYTLMEGINEANQNFLLTHDEMALAIDGYNSLLGTATTGFATFFDNIVTGSMSAGEAIKSFASSFIKAMLQILEQQAALAIVKTIIGAFGGAMAGGASGTTTGNNTFNFDSGIAPAVGTEGVGNNTFSFSIPDVSKIQGGKVGGAMVRFARGGTVQGSMVTRDSVHALLQPGEVVMNTGAVGAVGEDFLNGLNAQGNRVISKSTPAPQAKREKQPDHVNVWVVAPDQKPQLGPRDILATISDDVMRGGTTKQLIKQVAMGQM